MGADRLHDPRRAPDDRPRPPASRCSTPPRRRDSSGSGKATTAGEEQGNAQLAEDKANLYAFLVSKTPVAEQVVRGPRPRRPARGDRRPVLRLGRRHRQRAHRHRHRQHARGGARPRQRRGRRGRRGRPGDRDRREQPQAGAADADRPARGGAAPGRAVHAGLPRRGHEGRDRRPRTGLRRPHRPPPHRPPDPLDQARRGRHRRLGARHHPQGGRARPRPPRRPRRPRPRGGVLPPAAHQPALRRRRQRAPQDRGDLGARGRGQVHGVVQHRPAGRPGRHARPADRRRPAPPDDRHHLRDRRRRRPHPGPRRRRRRPRRHRRHGHAQPEPAARPDGSRPTRASCSGRCG